MDWILKSFMGINRFFLLIRKASNRIETIRHTKQFGFFATTSYLSKPERLSGLHKIFIYDKVNINKGANFIISEDGEEGKLIFKKNSGAAARLTVVTGNHSRIVGKWFKEISVTHAEDNEKDVIIEEDVWIGANVTLLPGVIIGRGATVGAGSVCLKSVPPYAVVMGNPAKVVGYNFTPEEIIEHEKALYPEEERLPLDLLEKNYNKYFISRIKEIKEFTRLSL